MPSTKPEELKKFIRILTEDAPEGYQPWLFPVQKGNKAPGTKGYSWKSERALLTLEEAIERLKNGSNVGISGRRDDRLILIDIDDPNIETELKPTLKIRSRSRLGTHAVYWAHPEDKKLPCNIPTGKGEVRSSDQYVVAPGGYVPCTKEELTKKMENGAITKKQKKRVMEDPDRGLYTIDNDKEVNTIKFKELPKVFRKKTKKDEEKRKEIKKIKEKREGGPIKGGEGRSSLFDLEIEDILPRTNYNKRTAHPLHNSDTGKNFSVGNGLAHCWRHLVSLNAIQYLVVRSGYMNCEEAGTSHRNTQDRQNHGPSYIIGDNRAIWEAWKEGRSAGYIPKDDPIPIRALLYYVRSNEMCSEEKIPRAEEVPEKTLPPAIYNKALKKIEEEV